MNTINFINFANENFRNKQLQNMQSAVNHGRVKDTICFSSSDIDDVFAKKNNHILSCNKGAGYWLWKPYIINKVLDQINTGENVMYCDSGCEIIKDLTPLENLLSDSNPFVCFEIHGSKEINWSKKECINHIIGADREMIYSPQFCASYMLFKATNKSREFVKSWLKLCENHLLMKDPKLYSEKIYKDFIAHRHDQSIFSLLCKKNGLLSFRDPSQWGNNSDKNKDDYGQLINHHRERDESIYSSFARKISNKSNTLKTKLFAQFLGEKL
jgi:hypothetical protein